MSRSSDAKKARRRRRLAARDSAWPPTPVLEDVPTAEAEGDEIGEAIGTLDAWLSGRGWVLDAENTADHVVSWVYPPSAGDVDDDDAEPVTRIWIVVDEDDEALELVFGATLVGTGSADDDGPLLLDPETLPDDIGVLESYRVGQPVPVLD